MPDQPGSAPRHGTHKRGDGGAEIRGRGRLLRVWLRGVRGSDVVIGAVDKLIPVDRRIPGCPPTPALLAGLIALMTRAAAEGFCAVVALTGA